MSMAQEQGSFSSTLNWRDIQYALWFGFLSSNNEAEYEALIAGLTITKELGVQHMKAYNDSQLIVGHILNEYEVREERMKGYLQKVKDLTSTFCSFNIQHVPEKKKLRPILYQSLQPLHHANYIHKSSLKSQKNPVLASQHLYCSQIPNLASQDCQPNIFVWDCPHQQRRSPQGMTSSLQICSL